MPADKPKSLMRSIGEFFGHIVHGIKHDPTKASRVVRHDVEEKSGETPDAQYTMRRTTIEEIEVRPKQPPGA